MGKTGLYGIVFVLLFFSLFGSMLGRASLAAAKSSQGSWQGALGPGESREVPFDVGGATAQSLRTIDITAELSSEVMPGTERSASDSGYRLLIEFETPIEIITAEPVSCSSYWSGYQPPLWELPRLVYMKCSRIMDIPSISVGSELIYWRSFSGGWPDISSYEEVYADNEFVYGMSIGRDRTVSGYNRVTIPPHTSRVEIRGGGWFSANDIHIVQKIPVMALPVVDSFNRTGNTWSSTYHFTIKAENKITDSSHQAYITQEQADAMLSGATLKLTNLSAGTLNVDSMDVIVSYAAKGSK